MSSKVSEDAVRILEDARSLIAEKGWTQDPDMFQSKICIGLAFGRVADSGYYATGAAGLLAWNTVGGVCGTGDLIGWNDTPGRTVEDVYAAIDEAIQELS
jgi:hypothetical protein